MGTRMKIRKLAAVGSTANYRVAQRLLEELWPSDPALRSVAHFGRGWGPVMGRPPEAAAYYALVDPNRPDLHIDVALDGQSFPPTVGRHEVILRFPLRSESLCPAR